MNSRGHICESHQVIKPKELSTFKIWRKFDLRGRKKKPNLQITPLLLRHLPSSYWSRTIQAHPAGQLGSWWERKQAGLGLGSESLTSIHVQALPSSSVKGEVLCSRESNVKQSKWGHGAWWWVTVTFQVVGRPKLQDHPPSITLQVLTLRAQVLFQASDVGRQAVKKESSDSQQLPPTNQVINISRPTYQGVLSQDD